MTNPRPRRAKTPIVLVSVLWAMWLACIITTPMIRTTMNPVGLIIGIVFATVVLVLLTWMALSRHINRIPSSSSRTRR